MGQFNPHAPDVLGVEWPGLFRHYLPIGQGVERGQTLHSTVSETIGSAQVPFYGQTPFGYRFHALATAYEKGKETAVGDVVTDRILVRSGTLSDATLIGGAASVQDALNVAGDQKRILFPTNTIGAQVDVFFQTAGLFTGRRILRVTLEAAVRLGTAATATQNLHLQMGRTDGALQSFGDLVADQSPAVVTIRQTGLGEICPMPPGLDPNLTPDRWPWSVADVQGFDTGGGSLYALRFINFYAPPISLYYANLLVTHCVENRLAVGARRFGSLSSLSHDAATSGPHTLTLRQPDHTANWSKVSAKDYAITVTSADGGGPFRGDPAGFDTVAFGAVPLMPTLDAFDVFTPHEGRQAPRGSTNALIAAAADSRISPVLLFTSGGAVSVDSMPYHERLAVPIYAGAFNRQAIVQAASGADKSYEFVRFWARKIGTPGGALLLTMASSQGVLTEAAFDALPEESIEGWKRVTLRWTGPVVLDNSSPPANLFFQMQNTAFGDPSNRWDVLGMRHVLDNADAATYGGATAAAIAVPPATGTDTDLAVHVATEPPTVPGFAASLREFDVPVLADCCPKPAHCDRASVTYTLLTWTQPAGVANFAYYEIQRSDDIDPVFRSIAKVHTASSVDFRDFEPRLGDIESSYQIRVCRTDGFCGPWSATVKVRPMSDGYAPGTLVFASNASPNESLLYVSGFEGGAVEEYTFPETATAKPERFFGRDFQPVFRPLERGGAQFSRVVVIDAMRGKLQTADRAFQALRDLAWADLPYIAVKDDQGNRWFSSLLVASGTVRRSTNVYLAKIDVVEVTGFPFAAERVAP